VIKQKPRKRIGMYDALEAQQHDAVVTAQEQQLTLADIDALHAKIDAFIDGLVAEEKAKMPNQPVQVLRALLVRLQCTCAAGRRLLQDIEP
jgi:hypothetical protein